MSIRRLPVGFARSLASLVHRVEGRRGPGDPPHSGAFAPATASNVVLRRRGCAGPDARGLPRGRMLGHLAALIATTAERQTRTACDR